MNQLSGTIPPTFGNLSFVNVLGLSSNVLTGTIPISLGNLVSLTELWLFGNTQLGGTIPSSLCSLPGIRVRIDCNVNIVCSCCLEGFDGPSCS